MNPMTAEKSPAIITAKTIAGKMFIDSSLNDQTAA